MASFAKAEAADAFRRRFAPGEVIFREGEAGDVAYIVEEGRVEISSLVNGRKHVMAVLGAGDLFGEMALIDQNERTASATKASRLNSFVGEVTRGERLSASRLSVSSAFCQHSGNNTGTMKIRAPGS